MNAVEVMDSTLVNFRYVLDDEKYNREVDDYFRIYVDMYGRLIDQIVEYDEQAMELAAAYSQAMSDLAIDFCYLRSAAGPFFSTKRVTIQDSTELPKAIFTRAELMPPGFDSSKVDLRIALLALNASNLHDPNPRAVRLVYSVDPHQGSTVREIGLGVWPASGSTRWYTHEVPMWSLIRDQLATAVIDHGSQETASAEYGSMSVLAGVAVVDRGQLAACISEVRLK